MKPRYSRVPFIYHFEKGEANEKPIVIEPIERKKNQNAFDYTRIKMSTGAQLHLGLTICKTCSDGNTIQTTRSEVVNSTDVYICIKCYRVYMGLRDYSQEVEFSMEPFNTIAEGLRRTENNL